ncbi:secreted ookinete adhesive protein, putative [Plasmodium yoelii]|uniref:Secreted ookinete adhesive protein n=2 Tax=Plasmodium yoelii TaxID=5861 RepID=A0AAF0B4S9_PLAYO|nr:secreted ookinete adhesive protein, putative [Plasmodium yoelii]WBY58201.1 secreted ookinete adhesive protein [Plasmodium yoelii yoelii]CDU85232.1 secreted ookinete adhesive protein, putative [Plasmodium yoelii]VTZ79127.1 secreted ookinete adhesive protein, putative [Plasmodium yoelii]|eukprot:XP_022813408.1 secreted ookinete adhesive protein, putative [Plasmodium yoelii]
MKRILLFLIPLLFLIIKIEGARKNSIRNVVSAYPHNNNVKNFSAAEIFGPKTTGQECVKCLPENFCECECSCKNKTGFSMKYRNASKGYKYLDGDGSNPLTDVKASSRSDNNQRHSLNAAAQAKGLKAATKSDNNDIDNGPVECFSSCKSVTGVQTEECSCSCYC